MDGSLFSLFYSIWETEVETFKQNFRRKHDQTNVISVKTDVLGNNMKRKAKAPQSDFPNFTGIYFSEYTLFFFIIWKNPVAEPVNINLNN